MLCNRTYYYRTRIPDLVEHFGRKELSVSLVARIKAETPIGHFGTGDLEITLKNHDDFERTKPLFVRSC
ncbi:hypothetical protein J2S73_001190 [Amorphus orientalis]|uniref:DUF6538 domain-containing protein n=1 Tax=Amorphus orientalis TaxID=649198 RepID=A0AAE3VMF7_9HYPH|nr:hypothetical protein [Amorphus orientalis]